jgi:exodeoxyribonuclease-3
VRVATWNVNSAKQRLPRLLPWLDRRQPDVVCLQETKLADVAFDELLADELATRGYAVARHGEAQWNGVAILSRSGLEEVTVGIPGGPGFPHQEARALSARCGAIRVHSVYVPNGADPRLRPLPLQARLARRAFATSSAQRQRRRWFAAT